MLIVFRNTSLFCVPVVTDLFCFIFPLQVEDSWKQTEFIVLPHRDSKDVFILGGIDDIQALLDDSMVKIAFSLFERHAL